LVVTTDAQRHRLVEGHQRQIGLALLDPGCDAREFDARHGTEATA
jgi:hypothetical protein